MSEITERLKVAIADRYVIERELGQGGMATVYLAHDVKHDRKVALKVLRPELAAVIGAERFLGEIKVTANLQHPHILPLHDSGEADGFLFYVMPYVEGDTLRDKLDREKQLDIAEAIEITRSVASALDYAHRQGVIHRDIKPENVLLHDGQALIADFGIALAVSHASGTRLTETGLSIGTPHYMSPEQAMGDRELDARSDIYSLGAMLFEMLAGEPPYTGNSAQAIVAKVITEKAPPVTATRDTVPGHVAAAVGKALAKMPADRFKTAAALAEALANPGFTLSAGTSAVESPVRPQAAPVWRRTGVAAAFALVLALALWGWLRPEPAPAVARYGLAFAPGQEPNDAYNASFALAPDGSWFVYNGPAESGSQLWIKRRDRFEAFPVPGTEARRAASAPTVSPDGEWIIFTADGQLRKVPRGGGSAITVADSVQESNIGIAWLDDGTVVYRDESDRLRRVPDVGGVSAVVWSSPEGETQIPRRPSPLPGARGVLLGWCPATGCTDQNVAVLDFESGELRVLFPDATQAWYTATGHIVYVRPDGGVFAAPFDLGALEVTGPPVPVLEGVQSPAGLMPDFALSPSGTMLMVAGPAGGERGFLVEPVWVSRDGAVAELDPEFQFSLLANVGWSLSPDGRRLVFNSAGDGGGDVWIKELDRGPLSRLTTDPAPDYRPRWAPDGRYVSFISERSGKPAVWRRRADGTQPAELVFEQEGPAVGSGIDTRIYEALWSRDGAWMVLRIGGTDGARDVWAQRVGVDSMPTRLLASDFDENGVALSPDGRWLAYQSDESGRNEIYVRPFPDIAAGKWTVSLGGGSRPLWSHSGRELFYVDGDNENMVVAQIRTAGSGEFAVDERLTLFSVDGYSLSANYTPFDIDSADERFLMVRRAGSGDDALPSVMILVENWHEELKEKVGR